MQIEYFLIFGSCKELTSHPSHQPGVEVAGWLLLFLHVERFQYLSEPHALSVWMLEHTMLNEAATFFCIFRLEPWLEPTAVLVILKYSHNSMLKNVWAGSGSPSGDVPPAASWTKWLL